MKKSDEELLNLSPEDQQALIKKRSRRRLFTIFFFIDIGLIAYIVYSLIMLFTHLN